MIHFDLKLYYDAFQTSDPPGPGRHADGLYFTYGVRTSGKQKHTTSLKHKQATTLHRALCVIKFSRLVLNLFMKTWIRSGVCIHWYRIFVQFSSDQRCGLFISSDIGSRINAWTRTGSVSAGCAKQLLSRISVESWGRSGYRLAIFGSQGLNRSAKVEVAVQSFQSDPLGSNLDSSNRIGDQRVLIA